MKERIVSLASRADFKIRKAPKTAIPEGFEEYDERPADVSEIFRGYRNAALEQLKEEYPILVEQVEFKQELTEKLAEPVREGKLEEKEINDVVEYIPNGNWDPEKKWHEIFVADQKEILYIRNIISGGEKLYENARVWVSTIHAAKGGEEDNVILSLHQGSKVQKSIRLSIDKQDEENRVWYVGITRARNNLYKLKAKKKIKEYQL